ncbi:hypothetical protein [Streptomyces acidiscabies]|uniref:hypothetical protein n=1 Tax=Streptomyces acidiscabies TaxID=42234 RepID=UPI00095EC317|nr:hypothetical protein [Streptomyces acidiscabies]GAV38203.1 hypothetical protein Saa2_01082 [Streptomyces acidiscabies]
MNAIDELLADAHIRTSDDHFDVGAALRRLRDDAAGVTVRPSADMIRATQAGQRLSVVCRWVLNQPGAADHVDRLAQEPESYTDYRRLDDSIDVDGALIFACLLFLTDHPESAQFWWQLAAGAGHRAAAYCLHLRHLSLSESKEASHWLHQVVDNVLDPASPDNAFLAFLESVAAYVGKAGSAGSAAPSGGLEMEVDRLAASAPGSCIIVRRPDRRLADRLHDDFTRR